MSRTLILSLTARVGDAEAFLQPAWKGLWTRVVVGADAQAVVHSEATLHLLPGAAVPKLMNGSVTLRISEIDQLEAAMADPAWTTIVFEPNATAMLDAISRQRNVLVACHSLAAGHVLSEDDVTVSLGGIGIPETMRDAVVGRALCYDLAAQEPITFGMIAECPATATSSGRETD